MKFKKTLGSIVLAGAIALGGCSYKEANPEYRNVAGKVYQSDQQELIYRNKRSDKNISVPITFLGVETKGKKYQIILVGPHNLKEGDSVNLDYLVDTEVTGKEIWNRFFLERTDVQFVTEPNVRFKTDGYARAWKKE